MNLPQIIDQSLNADTAEIKLAIAADLQAFEGHFDSAPIIPGVEQLRWVMEFAQQSFGLSEQLEVIRIDALKFQNIIQPGYQITLKLVKKEKRFDFSFTSKDLKHSSGKVFIQ